MRPPPLLLAPMLLAAVPAAARPTGVRAIVYQAGPCFGACPVYRLTVGSNGTARFEGLRHTTTMGIRDFIVTPAQWADFDHRLAAFRGHPDLDPGDKVRCRQAASDMASVDIRWAGAQRPGALHVYFGCDPKRNQKLFDRLRDALAALPIAAMVGPGPAT